LDALPAQRIVRLRRQYNQWVANETFEDYALRFTARSRRRWSHLRVTNTAIGSISFLALEAIGGIITLNCGFTNAVTAILIVSALIFVTSIPVSYYAARYGVDIDLLTRGAGFGYIGSTLSSIIYAIFTFIFLAIEASIMAVALSLWPGIPLVVGYVLSSLIIIPLVAYGTSLISRIQLWTQPAWIVLQLLPFLVIAVFAPGMFAEWGAYAGLDGQAGLNWALVGAGASIVFSLMGQIGEQADFLRFMPPKRDDAVDLKWWAAVIAGGPGWIVVGALKMLAGSLLAVLVIRSGLSAEAAVEPVEMYRVAFGFVAGSEQVVIALVVIFVVLCQVKINVTNAYAGSIAWSNFFARLTHSHPGRVVWLVFNVVIALLLVFLGVYRAFDTILAIYSNLAVAWIGALVGDLVINKPLGLSPPGIEFKRAHLHDVNPVGFGAMTIATVVALTAFSGALGPGAEAAAGFIGLATAFVLAPAIAILTGGKYYLARPVDDLPAGMEKFQCCICEYEYEREDGARCPAYDGFICSLCCTLDARCRDRCKPAPKPGRRATAILKAAGARGISPLAIRRMGRFASTFFSLSLLVVAVIAFVAVQGVIDYSAEHAAVMNVAWNAFWFLVIIAAIAAWMIVLARESQTLAQDESERQTTLLIDEIEAHKRTDAALQQSHSELKTAKEAAERANLAKSQYVIGMSHELRSPLNAVVGYAQILSNDASIPPRRRDAVRVVRRSAEHMSGLIDGLLEISKIESGHLYLQRDEFDPLELLAQVMDMFRLEATTKGLDFRFSVVGTIPRVVHGDTKRIRQILINLVSNAVKFTAAGHVLVRLRYRSMFAEIEVTDSGSGIHADDQARIFEPFERGKHSIETSGTGLGLTITKLLVSIMGGDISLTSEVGKGSTFKVRLMLSAVLYPVHNPRSFTQIAGYQGPRRSVLVVDDDPAHCAILAEALGGIGFAVHAVSSGEDALLTAGDLEPDLIVLDISMPGLNGWEVASRIRAEMSPGPRIVILSGNAFDLEASEERRASCDAALTKPVDLTRLFHTIGGLLDLEWVSPSATEAAARVASVPQRRERAMPSSAELADLRLLGEIGYVRGIKEKLAALAAQSDSYAWLVELLEPAVTNLDFPRYTRTLSEILDPGGKE